MAARQSTSAQLVLGWVTVAGNVSQPRGSTQPGHPSAIGAMSTSKRAAMLCSWGVKAGMVREWVTGKTV